MAYKQARNDFEYLEREVRELEDAVEIDSCMEGFMRNPTKAFAEQLYLASIELWLWECERDGIYETLTTKQKQRVRTISDRHCFDRLLEKTGSEA